jgi:hypothetical protein
MESGPRSITKYQMRENVENESRENRLHEKRARIRRRSFVGSLTCHSIVSGAAIKIKRISAAKSLANTPTKLRKGIPRPLRQRLWWMLYHDRLLDLHINAEIRSTPTYIKETMKAIPNAMRRQRCFSGNILAIDKERLKREPLEHV